MTTTTPKNVTLNLTGRFRGTYTLADDPDLLSALGPAILSHLGCSYEIRWPDVTEEGRQRRAKDRKATRVRVREHAEMYAIQHIPFTMSDEARDHVRELLAEAYRAGHEAAPKPVNR